MEYVNNDMLVMPDWYVCISIALDADEEEWYNRQYIAWVTSGNDPKKFPKRKMPYTESVVPEVSPQNIIMDALSAGNIRISGRKGNIDEYAESRGLQKVYQLPDGTIVDEKGEKVEPKAGSVFVRSKGGR